MYALRDRELLATGDTRVPRGTQEGRGLQEVCLSLIVTSRLREVAEQNK